MLITKGKKSSGFSVLELVISIAIFIIVTTVVLVGQHRFGGNILITNLAYDVALSVRQAQVYGISVRQNLPGDFQKRYGIHFSGTDYYVLFVDLNDDGYYDVLAGNSSGCIVNPPQGHSPECVSVYKIQRGNFISRFCGGTLNCTDSGDQNRIDSMDIVFRRPDPEAKIVTFKVGAVVSNPEEASITVSSPQGLLKTINVLASGQISVQ